MEFFKRSWFHIRAQLSNLNAPQQTLIAMSLLVMILAGTWLVYFAWQPSTMRLPPVAAEHQATSLARLKAAGINAKLDGGVIIVPVAQQDQALAILAQEDLISTDISSSFDQMLKNQNPWMSNSQNDQAFLLAKQKVLGQIIAKMHGVHSADVMVSLPTDKGFGKTAVRPSASVNIMTKNRTPLDRRMVEAIAGLVSGAFAGMKPQDVVVIDANLGRQFTVKSDQDVAPGETIELIDQIEQYHRKKIIDLLSYIPGVIIAVNVQTDPIQSKRVEEYTYEPSEGLKTEMTKETTRKESAESGAPGARSNTGADIEGSGGAGSNEQTTETKNEYTEKNITRKTQHTEVGRNARQINVTINVPRSYFMQLYQMSHPKKPGDAKDKDKEAEAPPDDEAIKPLVEAQLAKIKAQVEPIVAVSTGTTMVAGVVRADVVPDAGGLYDMGHPQVVQSTMASMVSASWIRPASLLMLALAAVVIMFAMVRKAMVQPPMPSVEELAGVPVSMPSEEELVGEADAGDASMAGVELDEEELRHRKIAEQISELVKTNPAEVAKLFHRWVRTDE